MPRSLLEATDDEILGALARYNWPNGRGKFWTVEHEQNYRRGLAEAKQILGATAMPALTYNPDARVDQQPDDFSCSIQSAEWLLRSIGRNPGDQWIQDQLLGAGIVTREHGLMDASGNQLARWLQTTYGDEMGIQFQASPVVYDDVYAGAGTNPMIIGGRAWNHWSGVRDDELGGNLILANPADGWKGVGQTMSREQFDALGPFTCVWVDRMGAVAPPAPDPVPEPPSRKSVILANIRTLLEELERIA